MEILNSIPYGHYLTLFKIDLIVWKYGVGTDKVFIGLGLK